MTPSSANTASIVWGVIAGVLTVLAGVAGIMAIHYGRQAGEHKDKQTMGLINSVGAVAQIANARHEDRRLDPTYMHTLIPLLANAPNKRNGELELWVMGNDTERHYFADQLMVVFSKLWWNIRPNKRVQ